MGELNAGDRALPFDEARDPLEGFEVFVAPDAKVLRGDPPFGRDCRCFGENQAGAADRARGQMGEMRIVGKPSSQEYWHIGETPMRLASVTPRV